MKTPIDFETIKRIARTTPDLSLSQFVKVWTEKLNEERRERDRNRKNGVKQTTNSESIVENSQNAAENSGNCRKTQIDLERALFDGAKMILGRNSSGMVAQLMKLNKYQVDRVKAVLDAARTKGDPRGYVATILRNGSNGTQPSLMDAFDRLDDRAASREIGDGPEIGDGAPRGD